MAYPSSYKKWLFLFAGILFGHLVNGQTTFIVAGYPENTPADADLYISGDFEGWTGGQESFRLKKKDDRYLISFAKSDKTIHYKITRGNWDTVEVTHEGRQIDNRSYSFLEEKDSVFVQIENWDDLTANPSTVSENVHLVDESFNMGTLEKERIIYIYLPESYNDSEQRYPVLYMQDGQNLFDESRSYSGEWEVDETLDKLSLANKLDLIIVGIDHGGQERIDEYSPWTLKEYTSKAQGDAYVKFIVQNLKPYIDQNYPTLKEREHTGIMGSSLGGLISFYAVLQYPETFGKAGVFSPSFELVSESDSFAAAHGNIEDAKIYFLSGDQESEHMVSSMEETIDIMLNAGFPAKNMRSKIAENGGHNEKLWREEFETAIKWLFIN